MKKYNLIVIGAGSGGLVASYIAATLKARVALIEKDKMGGDCLNTGCVPSKAFIRSAKVVAYTQKASKYGLKSLRAEFEFSDIMDRVQKVIQRIEPHDSIERYTKLGVDCYQGEAKLISPHKVQINHEVLWGKAIILATGAEPFVPPFPGLEHISYLTSDNLWNLRQLPQRLLVLGGGPIGCELAQSFQRLGSQVTLVERSPRIMSKEDPDTSSIIQKTFLKEGINLLTEHSAIKFKTHHHQ
ncbi:MAG: pyridine nucleotide-disulfide oxidoreductase, partial [Bdellovibrio sp.]